MMLSVTCRVRSDEYRAVQGWIEALKKTIGQDAFSDLLKSVEKKETKIVEKALRTAGEA